MGNTCEDLMTGSNDCLFEMSVVEEAVTVQSRWMFLIPVKEVLVGSTCSLGTILLEAVPDDNSSHYKLGWTAHRRSSDYAIIVDGSVNQATGVH